MTRQIEEQLRGVLRAEGDAIPLTITAAELERRLAARRSATGGRRLSLVAAAVAAVAVVSIVAVGNGWLKLPAIGTVRESQRRRPRRRPERAPCRRSSRSRASGGSSRRQGSTVLTEVLPTTFAGGGSRHFDADLPPDQYVVTVYVPVRRDRA